MDLVTIACTVSATMVIFHLTLASLSSLSPHIYGFPMSAYYLLVLLATITGVSLSSFPFLSTVECISFALTLFHECVLPIIGIDPRCVTVTADTVFRKNYAI